MSSSSVVRIYNNADSPNTLKNRRTIAILCVLLLLAAGLITFTLTRNATDGHILSYETQAENVHFFWKDETGKVLGSIQNLITYVQSKDQTLLFATNGGMYKKDFSPQGLFVQNTQTVVPLDTGHGDGNFYLKPNGVFYITTNGTPVICTASDFYDNGSIKFATQSGPMLMVNGRIHSSFRQGSANLQIRNGVGILPDNRVVFAMSKTAINFYDFAKYFERLGCKNALYLDGFVSRTYLPEKEWAQTDGSFGVIIGVVEKETE